MVSLRERSVDFNTKQAKYERKLHDKGAAYYDDIIVKRYGTKTRIIATGWAKRFCEPFLDYGCGTGQVSNCLVKRNNEVFAFDISRKSIRINVEKNRVYAVIADLFALPFKDKSFRTTCINGVMHHIIDLDTAFDEVARITSEFICVSESCVMKYHPLWLRFLRFVNILGLTKAYWNAQSLGSKYERALEPELLIKLLEARGFSVIEKKFYTNLSFLSDGLLKTVLIRMLISKTKGTHIEICTRRK